MTAREEVSRQDSRERTFASDLDDLLNRYSAENASNTPDFILGEFLRDSLAAFDKAVVRRSAWYGSDDQPGQKIPEAAEAQRPSVAGADGWRCFHCNETFTDRDAALEHFGQNETRAPACTVDIAAFREMEETMARWQSQGGNDDEYAAEIAAIARDNKHRLELQREEERGYAKGLADGRTETAAPRPPAAADIARPWRDDPATFPPAAADEREAWLEQAARVVIEAPTDTTPTEIAQQIRSMKAARPHPVAPAATQDELDHICPDCHEQFPATAAGLPCPECEGGPIESVEEWGTHQVPVSDEQHREIEAALAASSQLPAGQAVTDYRARNPLGGPAVIFDGIADLIRAGDSVELAMTAFGVQFIVPAPAQPIAPVGEVVATFLREVPTMCGAFVTAQFNKEDRNGKLLYELVFSFQDAGTLSQAHTEWLTIGKKDAAAPTMAAKDGR